VYKSDLRSRAYNQKGRSSKASCIVKDGRHYSRGTRPAPKLLSGPGEQEAHHRAVKAMRQARGTPQCSQSYAAGKTQCSQSCTAGSLCARAECCALHGADRLTVLVGEAIQNKRGFIGDCSPSVLTWRAPSTRLAREGGNCLHASPRRPHTPHPRGLRWDQSDIAY